MLYFLEYTTFIILRYYITLIDMLRYDTEDAINLDDCFSSI